MGCSRTAHVAVRRVPGPDLRRIRDREWADRMFDDSQSGH